MKNQVLSIDQMKELINMGINTSNADLYWYTDEDGSNARLVFTDILGSEIETHPQLCTPTLTLQDILEMLPDYFWIEKSSENIYKIKDVDGNTFFESKSLLYAAFNMLKWCKENNYI